MEKIIKTLLGVWSLFLLCLLILSRSYDLYVIVGSSMKPTIHSQNTVIAEQDPDNFARRDIILFQPPGTTRLYAKRIIGLAGDRIKVNHHRIYVNDHQTVSPTSRTKKYDSFPLRLVPQHHLFVMGDNPKQSVDSRDFGPISQNTVEGRIVGVLQPWSQFRIFNK
ncbi:signal peptidase I [Marininema mesophilum]|uniref:Signal peptidase I n=1 Tax=Marininema mesophilum TaxID=1048340 RepID=A0A1H2WD05_9BACL|nr:signal peptidase I [Marininema mesophilum]SDW77919.1 signal peptidase I [Marininema mesophilum]